ncbi:MAG: hypothetical protein ACR2JY_04360 [Chloroflexota bacterium]
MSLSEADTRSKLIDPALNARGWTEDLIRREETAGSIAIVDGMARKQSRGRVDYTLRVKVNADTHPVAVALIEAKAEHLPPAHGLEQGRAYADSKSLLVPFVNSSNGHLFVEYDRSSGLVSPARPLSRAEWWYADRGQGCRCRPHPVRHRNLPATAALAARLSHRCLLRCLRWRPYPVLATTERSSPFQHLSPPDHSVNATDG